MLKYVLFVLLCLALCAAYGFLRFKKIADGYRVAFSGNEGNGADIVSEEVLIDGSLGKIFGILQMPKDYQSKTLIIMSHGFGSKHEHTAPYGTYLAREGFATYCYSFCGGSRGKSKSDGTMLEMSVLTEAEDLNAVIDHFKKEERFDKIVLFGQSQGGFVSSYVAGKRPDDVAALMMEYPALVIQDDAKKRMNPDGTFPETSNIMGMKISRKYNEDALSFDIYDVIKGYKKEVLIIHGDCDQIVPLSYSQRAQEVYDNCKLIVLEGQNHGFMGDGLKKAMEYELEFFNRYR